MASFTIGAAGKFWENCGLNTEWRTEVKQELKFGSINQSINSGPVNADEGNKDNGDSNSWIT